MDQEPFRYVAVHPEMKVDFNYLIAVNCRREERLAALVFAFLQAIATRLSAAIQQQQHIIILVCNSYYLPTFFPPSHLHTCTPCH